MGRWLNRVSYQKPSISNLTQLTQLTSVSSVSDLTSDVGINKSPFVPIVNGNSSDTSKKYSSNQTRAFVWDVVVDGKRITVIDPDRLLMSQMTKDMNSKFGEYRVGILQRRLKHE